MVIFREWFAGSARLSKAMQAAMVAIAKRRGTDATAAWQKVARPRDILYDAKYMDLRVKENVGRAKKEMKDRLVFYEHFAPPCTTSSPANTRHRARTKLEPAGTQARAPEPYDQKVDDDTWAMLVACKLARIKHEVGDAFSVEHIWPTPMVEFNWWREFLALPGIFIVTFDNCGYGEPVRHRQMIITNQVWLCVLSRDCPGQEYHLHASIGFDKEVRTKDLAPYSEGLVARWSRALADFIEDPKRLCCPACSDEAGRRNWPGPARERRRAASVLVVEGAKLMAARYAIPGSLTDQSRQPPITSGGSAGPSFLVLSRAGISGEGPVGPTVEWTG